MTIRDRLAAIWRNDPLLRRVLVNSSHLLRSNVISSVLSFFQTILAVRLIGVSDWGTVATIQTFASNVNRLLSFRMSEVVVKNLAPALEKQDKKQAAALVKAAGLTEALTSVVAFLVLLSLTPLATRYLAKDPTSAPWFMLYGLILLSNIVTETSTGVLQASHRFDHLAHTNFIQSLVTATMIIATYDIYRLTGYVYQSHLLPAILLAYVTGKTYTGVSLARGAFREMNARLDRGWWRVSVRELPHKRALAVFALNTNFNGTVNVLFRDNIQLYLAYLLSTTEVGYFKIAMTLIIPITLVLDPLIAPTYSEISRTIARFEWETTQRLLKRISLVTGGVVGAMWIFWAVTGSWLIPLIYKAQALPVYPVLLILLAGYGFAGIFQWNRPLSLSLGRSGFPVLVSALAGLVEVVLIFLLVPRFGYLMMAVLLSAYFIVSIGIITARSVQEIHTRRTVSAIST